MASFLDTITSKLGSVGEAIVGAGKQVKQDFTDYYGGKDISTNVNKVISDVGTYGKQGSTALGSAIDKGLTSVGIQDSNFKGVLGGVGGSVASVPQNIVSSLRSGIEGAAETHGLISAGHYADAFARGAKTTASTALGVLGNITGVPIYINAGLAGAGLDKAVSEGVETLKSGLSTTLQKAGFNKGFSDDIGGAAIDGIQFYLMKKGGEKSANIGGKAKVQGFKDTIRQSEILSSIRNKAAKLEGATPESIAAAVERARPFVENAKAEGVTLADIAKNNIKSLGYDVAYNLVIPVLGLGVKAVENGEYKDLAEAFGSNVFSSAVAGIIPGFKGIKAMKTKPSPDQMTIDEAPVKPITEPIKDEGVTAINDAKRFSNYTEPTPVVVPTKKGKSKSKTIKEIVGDPAFMRDYRRTNELIDAKNSAQDNTNRLASEFDAMNAKQDQKSAEFVAKQDAAKTPQNERFMQEYRDVNDKIQKTEADQAYLDSRKAEFDAMNAKQDQKSAEFVAKQDARGEALRQQVFAKLLAESDIRAGRKEELDTLTAEREADTQQFADMLNAKNPDNFITFMDTNPTSEQGMKASILMNRNSEGVGNLTTELREDTTLTPAQKEILMKTVIDDKISEQKGFFKTIQDATSTDGGIKDIPFTAEERNAAGIPMTAGEIFAEKRAQTNEPSTTSYRTKFGKGSIAGTIYKNVSDITALNNIEGIVDGKSVDMGNHLESMRKNEEATVRDAVATAQGLNRDDVLPILSWNKTIDPKDLIGKKTEYYGSEITPENVQAYLKSNVDNAKNIDGMIDGFKNGELANGTRASFLYSLIKNDPHLVAKYFSPEQLAVLKKFDADNIKLMQNQISTQATMEGQLPAGTADPEYMRLVMTKDNYDNAPKGVVASKIVMDIGNGQTRTFKNALEAESFVRLMLARGETLTPDMQKFSSLAKEQAGPALDPYRIHGGFASAVSYAKAMGEMYGSTRIAKELTNMSKSKDIAPYMDSIRNNFFGSNLEQRVLGLDTLGENSAQKWANRIGWLGSAKAIFGNVSTFAKGGISATAKNLTDASRSAAINIVKGNFQNAMRDIAGAVASIPGTLIGTGRRNTGGILDTVTRVNGKKVQEALANENFITGYGVGETLGQGWLGKGTALSSAIRQENSAKTDIALRSMRRILTSNGYKVKGGSENIVDTWNTFKKEKPAEYVYERNNIINDTLLVGNVSKMSRLGFLGAQRILGPIKTFSTGLVSSAIDDTRTIYQGVKDIFSEKGIDLDRTGAAGFRLVSNLAVPLLIYSKVYDSLPDDMDDKVKDKIAKTWQEMTWQTSTESIVGLIQGLPESIGVSAVADIGNAIGTQLDIAMADAPGVDKKKAMFAKGIDDFRRLFAAANSLNRATAISGETLQEKITNGLGAVNIENTNQFGVDIGSRVDSWQEAVLNLIGLSIDNPVNALLRKPDKVLSDPEKEAKRGLLDFLDLRRTIEDADVPFVWGQARDTYVDALNLIFPGEDKNAIGKNPAERAIIQQSTYDVLETLNGPKKDFSLILTDLGVDPRLTTVAQEGLGDHINKILTQNDAVEKGFSMNFDPKKINTDGYLQTFLADLHTKNPKAYGDVASWLGEIRGKAKDFDYSLLEKTNKGVQFKDKAAQEYWKTKLSQLNDSSDIQNAAIADYYDERSLTTSAINSAFKILGAIDPKTATQKEIQDAMGKVNGYLDFMQKNGNYTGNHTNAAALQVFPIAQKLLASAQLGKMIDPKKYPVFFDFLLTALDLRGEATPKSQVPGSAIATSTGGGGGVAQKGFSDTIASVLSSDVPTVGTDKKKQAALKLQSGSNKNKKVEGIGPVKSLAEIVSRPQIQVGQQQVGNTPRFQDLATFSRTTTPTPI